MHEKDGSIHSPSSSTFCATRLWNRRQGIRNRTPVMLMWWLFVGLVHILLISDGRCTTGAIKIPPFKSTTGVRSIGTTTTSSTPYRLGNFVYRDNRDNNTTTRQQEPRPSTMVGHKSILESLLWNKQNILRQLLERYGGTIQRVFHLLVFGFYTKNSILSILEDQWEAERNPEKVFSQRGIWYQGERKVVKRRTVQASVMRKYVGVGYTPRYVPCCCLLLYATHQWGEKISYKRYVCVFLYLLYLN